MGEKETQVTTLSIPPNRSVLTLEDLAQSPQWVCWRLERHHGRLSKVPYSTATGRLASSTDPATWSGYEHARTTSERSRGYYQGIGFVFCAQLLPVMGVDFDHCVEQG